MSNIILADDHALMRQALQNLLSTNGHQIVATAQDYSQLKQALEQLLKSTNAEQANAPDIIICDCKMPGDGPVNLLFHLNQLKQSMEQVKPVKVIFLTALDSGALFQQLISLGVNALVSKKGEIDDILKAIAHIKSHNENIENKVYLSTSIEQSIKHSPQVLSNKEFQVLELIVAGLNNNEIAEKLCRSPSTVNTHRVSLMQKLQINNVVDLIHFARDNGLYDE